LSGRGRPLPCLHPGRLLAEEQPRRLRLPRRRRCCARLIGCPDRLAPDASLTTIVGKIRTVLDCFEAGPAPPCNARARPSSRCGHRRSDDFELGPLRDTYVNDRVMAPHISRGLARNPILAARTVKFAAPRDAPLLLHRPLRSSRGSRVLCRPRRAAPSQAPGGVSMPVWLPPERKTRGACTRPEFLRCKARAPITPQL
jgi:hypothetical protein